MENYLCRGIYMNLKPSFTSLFGFHLSRSGFEYIFQFTPTTTHKQTPSHTHNHTSLQKHTQTLTHIHTHTHTHTWERSWMDMATLNGDFYLKRKRLSHTAIREHLQSFCDIINWCAYSGGEFILESGGDVKTHRNK